MGVRVVGLVAVEISGRCCRGHAAANHPSCDAAGDKWPRPAPVQPRSVLFAGAALLRSLGSRIPLPPFPAKAPTVTLQDDGFWATSFTSGVAAMPCCFLPHHAPPPPP